MALHAGEGIVPPPAWNARIFANIVFHGVNIFQKQYNYIKPGVEKENISCHKIFLEGSFTPPTG